MEKVTTIVYRDGVCAADTRISTDRIHVGAVVKIARRGPFLAGAVGSATYGRKFMDWFSGGLLAEDEPKMPEHDNDGAYGFIFTPDGTQLCWSHRGWLSVRAPYYAEGSGQELALGALWMGATAEQAVRAAMSHDGGTGGDVVAMRHYDGDDDGGRLHRFLRRPVG